MSLSSSLSSSKPTGILKKYELFQNQHFHKLQLQEQTTASTIYENSNFETTHSLFKIPVDLDYDIQNGLNEDDGNKQRIELLNNTSYNISLEGIWKPKNGANIEFYPGFLSKIQNSRA